MYDIISWCIAITIFCRIFCFEEVARGLDGISNNRLNLQTNKELYFCLITTSINNLSEIHISQPTPNDFLSVPYFFLTNLQLSFLC